MLLQEKGEGHRYEAVGWLRVIFSSIFPSFFIDRSKSVREILEHTLCLPQKDHIYQEFETIHDNKYS
ncbi:hypothetical protein ABEB36_007702 [Hypothenemus hampei]|uniref:Uncharacterized protein n=1 Tax=Hypothenemus hampei TaxID=57062 RepID=A0ABD1EUV7_HYPHA